MSDADFLAAALVGYEQQRVEIEKKIAELRRQLGGLRVSATAGGAVSTDGGPPAIRKRRQMSGAGRKRIAEAQRKRWAAARKATNQHLVPAAKPAKKRKISAAARKRMSEVTKKRWAVFRAKKTS
jgi:hypothetical protein